ncbi:hypothetical protein DPEC_G00211180 [Dallia pectoralis]|uniref:Uncharacterized protein n=1 Tax=Dallia pectoralis TaxID=75939 RepID=A0ACC2G641_DALPE|nr:hypothetical protein DPEC_G00211180 [Dallia pectoralis]
MSVLFLCGGMSARELGDVRIQFNDVRNLRRRRHLDLRRLTGELMVSSRSTLFALYLLPAGSDSWPTAVGHGPHSASQSPLLPSCEQLVSPNGAGLEPAIS